MARDETSGKRKAGTPPDSLLLRVPMCVFMMSIVTDQSGQMPSLPEVASRLQSPPTSVGLMPPLPPLSIRGSGRLRVPGRCPAVPDCTGRWWVGCDVLVQAAHTTRRDLVSKIKTGTRQSVEGARVLSY
jgi:hypothetical protein